MNIKKRIVSALMALVMTLSLVNSAVITAFAEGTQSADPSTGETQGAGYELRVLTFEDADYKGGTNFAGKSDWSSLIDSPQVMPCPTMHPVIMLPMATSITS